MERHYKADVDFTKGYGVYSGEVDFWSPHRAGSAANLEDCKEEVRRRKGSCRVEVRDVRRIPDDLDVEWGI